MADNYEKQVLIARELFLKYDQQKMIDKFHLRSDEEYLYISFLDREYRISRKSGVIESENNVCMDYNIVMTIYDVLCCSKEMPLLSHQWVTQPCLQVTMSSPESDIFTRKYAEKFSGKTRELLQACRKISGRVPKITAGSDVCYEFDMFPFFPVQFRYWDRDEEFPAQIKLLWDKNSLDFMHFETTYYAMNRLLRTLEENME